MSEYEPPKLSFYVAIPSVTGMDDWVVFENTDLKKPLFVGAQEAAEYDASRRNAEAGQRYEEQFSAQVAESIRSDARRRSEAFMAEVEARTKLQEEILAALEQNGAANDACLAALSLPI